MGSDLNPHLDSGFVCLRGSGPEESLRFLVGSADLFRSCGSDLDSDSDMRNPAVSLPVTSCSHRTQVQVSAGSSSSLLLRPLSSSQEGEAGSDAGSEEVLRRL